MAFNYFQAILPTTFFAPNAKASIRGISVQEQFDVLTRLYYDASSTYRRDDYMFYNFWTGFLYALSRSNIPELVLFILDNAIYKSHKKMEHLTAVMIFAYFLKYFYRFFEPLSKMAGEIHSQQLTDIVNELLARGYLESGNKQQIMEDVLSRSIDLPEFADLRDFLILVLDVLRRSSRLDTTFDLIR